MDQQPGSGQRCHARKYGYGRPLSAICQHISLARPCTAGRRLDLSVRTNWDDVMLSMALDSSVWGPHSLHTAEATGSKPVTPTSTNRLVSPLPGPSCQQIASRPPAVGAKTL